MASIVESSDITASQPVSYINPVKVKINAALSLDMTIFPRRYHINPSTTITTKKQASKNPKLILLINAAKWGYITYNCTYEDRTLILRALAQMVIYDNGYMHEFIINVIQRLDKITTEEIKRAYHMIRLEDFSIKDL